MPLIRNTCIIQSKIFLPQKSMLLCERKTFSASTLKRLQYPGSKMLASGLSYMLTYPIRFVLVNSSQVEGAQGPRDVLPIFRFSDSERIHRFGFSAAPRSWNPHCQANSALQVWPFQQRPSSFWGKVFSCFSFVEGLYCFDDKVFFLFRDFSTFLREKLLKNLKLILHSLLTR